MIKVSLSLIIIGLLVLACGREQDQNSRETASFGRNSTQHIYGFTGKNERGQACVTGRFVFSSVEEYCAALQDETRNLGCARQARRRTYEITCL